MKRGFLLILIVLMYGCAQVVPLNGGKRDVLPPKLLEAIPSNKSNNFNAQEIVLKFNEYIQLKDAANQIVMQPQLKLMPEFEVQGKTLKIKLLHQYLEPGTTYRIDFGRAIADMHESNVLENFDYVFSTGPQIDTLKLNGKISSAFNNKDVAGATIALYANINWYDSLPFKTKPTYFAKSDAAGAFHFFNLPHTRFLVYAFDDKNKNLQYDGEAEQVAMLGPPLQLVTNSNIELKLFKEEPTKTFIKKTSLPYYGFGQLIWNKPVQAQITALVANQGKFIQQLNGERMRDTTSFLYTGIEDTLAILVQNTSSKRNDTLKLILPKKPLAKKGKLTIRLNEQQGKLNYKQHPILNFSNWMDTVFFKKEGILLKSPSDSSMPKQALNGRWISLNQFELMGLLKEGNKYELKIEKSTFQSIDGITNDSVMFEFKMQAKSDFGKFNLKLNVSRSQNYVLQILDEKEEVVKEQVLAYTAFREGKTTLAFTDLLPGNYSVKIIFDNNENKKWDRGDVSNLRLPEPVIISRKRIKIISDWETEEEISLGEQE